MKLSQINSLRPWWAVELGLEAVLIDKTLHIAKAIVFSRDGVVYANVDDGDDSTERFVAAVDDSDEEKIFALWSAMETFFSGLLQDSGMTVWISELRSVAVLPSREVWLSRK